MVYKYFNYLVREILIHLCQLVKIYTEKKYKFAERLLIFFPKIVDLLVPKSFDYSCQQNAQGDRVNKDHRNSFGKLL